MNSLLDDTLQQLADTSQSSLNSSTTPDLSEISSLNHDSNSASDNNHFSEAHQFDYLHQENQWNSNSAHGSMDLQPNDNTPNYDFDNSSAGNLTYPPDDHNNTSVLCDSHHHYHHLVNKSYDDNGASGDSNWGRVDSDGASCVDSDGDGVCDSCGGSDND